MIIVPVVTHHHPTLCPSCGKPERRVEACAHCGHRYLPDPAGDKEGAALLLAAFAVGGTGACVAVFRWPWFTHYGPEGIIDYAFFAFFGAVGALIVGFILLGLSAGLSWALVTLLGRER